MGIDGRKLSAVLFGDMVGFSALHQEQALELRDELMNLVDHQLGLHRGRLVNTMGDGFFAEFRSALDAVQFATDLQASVELRNTQSDRNHALSVRLGIHVGEVVQQGQNLLGATVNIGARTEKLAAPGGICLTGEVWDLVCDDVQRPVRSLGRLHVRHIRQNLQFYHIDPAGANLRYRLGHRLRTSALRLGKVSLLLGVPLILALLSVPVWHSRGAPDSHTRGGQSAEVSESENELNNYKSAEVVVSRMKDPEEGAVKTEEELILGMPWRSLTAPLDPGQLKSGIP